jgi:hypothetical protein
MFRVVGVMALCVRARLGTGAVHRAGRTVCVPHRTVRPRLGIRGAVTLRRFCLPVGGAARLRDKGGQGRHLAGEPGSDPDPRVPPNDTHPPDELSGLSAWDQSRLLQRVAGPGMGVASPVFLMWGPK